MKLHIASSHAALSIALLALAATPIVTAQIGTNKTLSVIPAGTATAAHGNATQGSISPMISDDGTVVAYGSTASNITTATDANPGTIQFSGASTCAGGIACNTSSDFYV